MSNSMILLITALIALAASPSTADENNLLLTGEVLTTDSQLSNDVATFVVQNDCNLVLYNTGKGFQSNSHAAGLNCTLTLSNRGQLIIHSGGGGAVWTSPATGNAKVGKYAAVLRPDGQVAVYGASAWSTPISYFGVSEEAYHAAKLSTTATAAKNVLFTDQILHKYGHKLTTRDYTFIMRGDCTLALVKAGHGDIWNSGTVVNGDSCYTRMGRYGELTVIDENRGYSTLWSTNRTTTEEGEYVLILQINGQARIYGPKIWSTATPSKLDGQAN